MKVAKVAGIIFAILLITYVAFIFYLKYPRLAFYNIPEYYFEGSDDLHETEELIGYERKQFAICLPQRWCSYKYVQKDYFVIYRNNNKYSDKQFGTVQEIKDSTYVIEVVNPDKQKSLKEIPKTWVFGKD